MWNLRRSIAGAVGQTQKIKSPAQPIALMQPRNRCCKCSRCPHATTQKKPNNVKNFASAKGREPLRQLLVEPKKVDLAPIYGHFCKQIGGGHKECSYSSGRRPSPRLSFAQSTKPIPQEPASIAIERLVPAALQHKYSIPAGTNSKMLLKGVQGVLARQRIEGTSPQSKTSKSTRPGRSSTKDKSSIIAQKPHPKSSKSIEEKQVVKIKSHSSMRSARSKRSLERKHSAGSMSLKSVDLLKCLRKLSMKRPTEKDSIQNDIDSAAKPPDLSSMDDPTNSMVNEESCHTCDFKPISSVFLITPSKYPADYLPIDIMKHKDDFLSLHSLERNFKNTMPRIWPMTEAEIIKQEKMESMKAKPRSEGDHRLAKRILRLNLRKAVGCQTEPSSSADSCNRCDSCNSGGKYSIPCYRPATDSQQHRKQTRRRHEVGCQTEYSICVLCQIESQLEPDEPYMIKMKQRRQREELQVYYRQMGRPAPSKSHSDRSLRHMRTQLELYLEILAHCDRIVDDELQARTKNVSNQC